MCAYVAWSGDCRAQAVITQVAGLLITKKALDLIPLASEIIRPPFPPVCGSALAKIPGVILTPEPRKLSLCCIAGDDRKQ